jgi:multidrug transporter EmrE-like cation transporter
VRLLLDPRANAIAGIVLAIGSLVWTIITITLTSEPPNVIAMSGLALVLAGLQMIQNSLTMRKIEVETPD